MLRVLRFCCVVLTILLAAPVLCAAPAPDDWPSFRGSPDMQGVARSTLPSRPRQLWRADLKAPIASTAAIVGDTVYIATQKGEVVALWLANGRPRWRFSNARPAPRPQPARTGHTTRAQPPEPGDAFSASPLVAGGMVYVGDEGGTFYALDAQTGKRRWALKTNDKIMSSATPAPGVVLFGSYDCNLYCVDARTGKPRWKLHAGQQVHCSPCVAEGKVIIAGCDGHVRIIDLRTGRERAGAAFETSFATAPAYARGVVYEAALDASYVAVRLKDGKTLWKRTDSAHAEFMASAAVAGSTVVFATKGRKVFAVDAATGKPRWSFATKDEVESSPVVCGGTVFVGSSEGNLYALDLKTGRKTWQFGAGAPLKASPAVARGRLVIGSDDGALYCFGG